MTPATMPEVSYLHHWSHSQRLEVSFLIPVDLFLALSRCRIYTTPTYTTHYPQKNHLKKGLGTSRGQTLSGGIAQREIAAAAVELLPWLESEAEQRRIAAGGNHGNQYTGGKVADVEKIPPPADLGKSRDKAADASRNQSGYPLVFETTPLSRVTTRRDTDQALGD